MPHPGLKVLGICLFPIWIVGFGSPSAQQQTLKLEEPQSEIAVYASGRGYPWINLDDGRSLGGALCPGFRVGSSISRVASGGLV